MDIDDIILENRDVALDADIFDLDFSINEKVLPEHLKIIPIRYRPIFPGIVTPLIISNGKFSETIDRVMADNRFIGLVLIKDDNKDEVSGEDLYSFGTVARILKKINLPDGGVNLLISSVKRFSIESLQEDDNEIAADVQYLSDKHVNKNNIEIKALTREILSQMKMLSENNPLFTEEMKLTMVNVDEPGKIADFVTTILNLDKSEYQAVLENLDVKKRLRQVLLLLNKEMEVVSVQKKIQSNINEKIDKQQKEFFLREQLKAIKQELGLDGDERSSEVYSMKQKVEELGLQGEVKEKVMEEVEKISFMDPSSSEYSVTRNYLDIILSLPWNKKNTEVIDLDKAEKILDRDHYGLDDVKERILEFMAVRKLNPQAKGSIICLVGPPGVGKTSLGKSIAEALNRQFYRVSLGGMRDEAEIRGHRRTYIGAIPGKIIMGIKNSKSMNPVFMLDEIDKLGQSFQGDPGSALLEVLDPEQNSQFRDHYLDIPFDLSDVLFVTTANMLDSIPLVLRDRMEIIRLSGYITHEKYEIAKRYLLPKQLKLHGLKKNQVSLSKKNIISIVEGWAREAGVRTLERSIETICRKTATLVARKKKLPDVPLADEVIREYLGPERFNDEELIRTSTPGIVMGLAWTSMGGSVLYIETLKIPDSKGGTLQLTGQMGDVMTESATIAFNHIRSLLGRDENIIETLRENRIHIHVPAGAVQKDGPSAGITMAVSIFSLLKNKPVRKRLAMTGELTLSGQVYPVGGIKEKIIAARRSHVKEIILPDENRRDLEEIAGYVTKGITFHFVKSIEEVISLAF
jgi:ATP-dependent Lon protease